ncbi:unnamed protein product [Penicillium olsonii]|uniref:PHD-type domain-containing protein n=1 Tax=Penicillium olsonii TaxID=99116 RepID=A0A9W4HSE6_PENOL|nr:unnamed protein product [Penicillium olsonii]
MSSIANKMDSVKRFSSRLSDKRARAAEAQEAEQAAQNEQAAKNEQADNSDSTQQVNKTAGAPKSQKLKITFAAEKAAENVTETTKKPTRAAKAAAAPKVKNTSEVVNTSKASKASKGKAKATSAPKTDRNRISKSSKGKAKIATAPEVENTSQASSSKTKHFTASKVDNNSEVTNTSTASSSKTEHATASKVTSTKASKRKASAIAAPEESSSKASKRRKITPSVAAEETTSTASKIDNTSEVANTSTASSSKTEHATASKVTNTSKASKRKASAIAAPEESSSKASKRRKTTASAAAEETTSTASKIDNTSTASSSKTEHATASKVDNTSEVANTSTASSSKTKPATASKTDNTSEVANTSTASSSKTEHATASKVTNTSKASKRKASAIAAPAESSSTASKRRKTTASPAAEDNTSKASKEKTNIAAGPEEEGSSKPSKRMTRAAAASKIENTSKDMSTSSTSADKGKKPVVREESQESFPPAPTGSTQHGDNIATSSKTRRKLQKEPQGTSQSHNPWRTMRPIGEYPSPAEYRAAGLKPHRPQTLENVATPALSPDSGLEDLTLEEGPADTPADAVATTTAAQSPDVETPIDDSTPAIATPALSIPDYQAVFRGITPPTSERYDVSRIRRMLEFALDFSMRVGNAAQCMSLVHFWHMASEDEFNLALASDLFGHGQQAPELHTGLMHILKDNEPQACEWYQSYTARPSLSPLVDLPPPSGSGTPSARPTDPQSAFKVSDIYRDTSGPRLEEQFLSGKTNTAPLKRPKKPCPVNEAAHRRKLQWQSDPDHDENMRQLRLRFSQAQPDVATDVRPAWSAVRDERVPEMNPQRSRSSSPAPVPESFDWDSDSQSASPVRTAVTTATNKKSARKPTSKPTKKLSKKQKGKRPQRARSLSIDTTMSDVSTLSNSCYSVRDNDWAASHGERQMPNSIDPPDNSDECHQCGKGGNLICCETCPNSYHFTCLDPPLNPKNPPEGEWHCPKCQVRNSFTTLLAHGKKAKKTEFSLPQDIKERFLGVGEGVVYDPDYARNPKHQRYYRETPHLPRLTKPPKHDVLISYADPMLLRDVDNKGQKIICMKCGQTSNGRPIITCDYCPCRFHLDCLDPPRAQPPNPKTGWMCPNHVTPADMVVTKEVGGGELRTRRHRRTAGTSFLDCEILLPDGPNDSLFSREWRDERHIIPAGDVVFEFIGAVKWENCQRVAQYSRIEAKCLDAARSLARQFFREGRADPELVSGLPPSLAEGVSESVGRILAGTEVPQEAVDAATALLGLSRPSPTSGEGSGGPQPSEAGPSRPKRAREGSTDEGRAARKRRLSLGGEASSSTVI